MTNIEAGRVLGAPPPRLASRPLFDATASARSRRPAPCGPGPSARPSWSRPRWPGLTRRSPSPAHEAVTPPAPGALAGSAPETWSLRAKPVFDPDAVETAPPLPVYRLEHATPAPAPREDPPAPPK